VVLGCNGTRKSLLVKYLSNPELLLNVLPPGGEEHDDWNVLDSSKVAFVSFDSHLQVLKEEQQHTKNHGAAHHHHLTVHDAITGGV
jgi:hypothetical protein